MPTVSEGTGPQKTKSWSDEVAFLPSLPKANQVHVVDIVEFKTAIPLHDVVLLARCVNDVAAGYDVALTRNCYWFAYVFVEALKSQYRNFELTVHTPRAGEKRGSWHSLPAGHLFGDTQKMIGEAEASFFAQLHATRKEVSKPSDFRNLFVINVFFFSR